MKKLLLLLLLSLGFISAANAYTYIPLPSEQAVREYIYLSLFSCPKLLSNQEIIKLEAEWHEANAKEAILTEQYRITTDEEEKFAVGKKAFEQRTEMKRIQALLDKQANYGLGLVSVSPQDYGLFKNHRIFEVYILTRGLERTIYFEQSAREMIPEQTRSGTSASTCHFSGFLGSGSSGYFYTDGKSINYLHGDSRVSILERLLKNEKLQFETVNPQALASFVSDVLFTHENVIKDMSDVFRSGNVIMRNENSINEDCPKKPTGPDYTEDEWDSMSEEEKSSLGFESFREYRVIELIRAQLFLESDYPECIGFTDQELTTLSHEELIEIAKKRGFNSLLGIVLPSLKKEGDNWILEFTTIGRGMLLHNITFSPEYKVSLK